jgi:hypothetical protein
MLELPHYLKQLFEELHASDQILSCHLRKANKKNVMALLAWYNTLQCTLSSFHARIRITL